MATCSTFLCKADGTKKRRNGSSVSSSKDSNTSFEELTEEPFRRFFVPSALHKNVEHVAILVHGPPEVVRFSVDLQVHFIQVPFVTAARTATTQLIRIGLSKGETPPPHCFICYDDPTLRQKFFHIAKTEGKAKIQPDCVTDNFRWETVAFVIGNSDVCFHQAI